MTIKLKNGKKRHIVPVEIRKTGNVETNTMLRDMDLIMELEIRTLREKVEAGRPLTAGEAGKLVKYSDAAVRRIRLQRDIDRDFEDVTEEELEELEKKALKALLPVPAPEK